MIEGVSSMKIGQMFRYARPYSESPAEIDGLPNFFAATKTSAEKKLLLEAGIQAPARIKVSSGHRVPAILIRSSPHKAGSESTPWQDVFRPDQGHIRYFGDNKTPGKDPSTSLGNKLLIEQFNLHNSNSEVDRSRACPIVCFRSVPLQNRKKGQIEFQGIGLVERVELVSQIEPKAGMPFVNYVFDFLVLSLLTENEQLDWTWIDDRQNRLLDLKSSNRNAPAAWQRWVQQGASAFSTIRRAVSKRSIVRRVEQQPPFASKEARILDEVYEFYEKRKHRFEALAAAVADRILTQHGGVYRRGWVTRGSSDNGIDFVGRLDIGSELACTKLVVLGQAKCEDPASPTNGNDIARTVARLRRGWIGVYVTTSYFTPQTQSEIIEDQYPIILVDGYRLAREINAVLLSRAVDCATFLAEIDAEYELQLARRSPEEVLLI
jgi:Restriction endonuclease AspBHI N-terminal/Restriction endonuclease